MRKLDIYQGWTDGWRFVVKNRGKFILVFLAIILVVLFGIWRAFAFSDTEVSVLSGVERHNLIRLIAGRRGFFGYWMLRFLSAMCVVTLILLCGMRPYLSFAGILAILIFVYFSGFVMGAILITVKLAALPLTLVCLIPCLIILQIIFAFLYIHTVLCALCRPRFYYFTDFCIEVRRPFLLALLAVLTFSFLETILVCIFSIGIIL